MLFCLLALALSVLTEVRSQFVSSPADHNNAQSDCYFRGQPQRCQPVFMNAAYGRRVVSTNTCGETRSTRFCSITESQLCDFCVNGDPLRQHPATYLTDFNNAENETWWQSETMMEDVQYPNHVNLTLDLGKSFDITYVRLKFGSPRPESFAIYKKTTSNGPWEPFQYYSTSCRDTYGLPDLVYLTEGNEDRAVCTSEFSDIVPLTGGEVAFATLEGRPGGLQFDYNAQLQRWVTATALRITLNRLNTFGDEVFRDPAVLQSYYYAITDLAVGATCKCNGHASSCVPISGDAAEDGEKESAERVVCQCQHNTAGADCDRCLPFYNDAPWRRATPRDAHECQACNCNGFSDRCYFDKELYELTGHGGHCTDCSSNRDGVNCERCLPNHYEREDGYCAPCACDSTGSRDLQCNSNGECSCKPGVGGDKCDRCQDNYYQFTGQGCRECNCHVPGSLDDQPSCDSTSGLCSCKANVEGQTCDRCKPGFFSISQENRFGCTPCFCFGHSSVCQTASGYTEVIMNSEFLRGDEAWKADKYYSQEQSLSYRPLIQSIGASASGNEPIYFRAPARYLGDQRASYNQDLIFRLRIGEVGPEVSAQDLVLQGSGMEVTQPVFGQGNPLPDQKSQEYTFRLHEEAEYGWTPRLRARDFIAILSNLTSIKIRATYTPQGVGYLESFALVSARRGRQGKRADWVETCTCPTGYVGQFCESCEPGFHHEPANGGPFSRCVPCDCNGHADICDAQTGECICRDNTAGDHCEVCARGYYGNALTGGSDDCQRCPCPGQGACMEVLPGETVCLECPSGYAGHRCEICIDGWFGMPPQQPCQQCDCNGNIDLNAVGNCDRSSGQCLKCIHSTDGFSCDKCLPGYYGDPLALPKGDCRSCACEPVGTVRSPQGPNPDSFYYLCDQLSGQCVCKPYVTGIKCQRCVNGYWNINSGQGCESCDCDVTGSLNASCDVDTGRCHCRPGVVGDKCHQCDVNMYGFSLTGCKSCQCDPIGSLALQCDNSGQCPCRENVEGTKCDRCKENKFDRQAGCKDCAPCYSLVQDAVTGHRSQLQLLASLLHEVTSNPQLPDDAQFAQRLADLTASVRRLHADSLSASGAAERSPQQLLTDMEDRLREIGGDARLIVQYMLDARQLSGQGVSNMSEAEKLMQRVEQTVKETLIYLEAQGGDALRRAVERSKQFGFQSDRMSEIARESRRLASEHGVAADAVLEAADSAVSNATAAYNLAYQIIEKQRNFSNVIGLLDSGVRDTQQLMATTADQADQAHREAALAYEAALNAYTDAMSSFNDVAVEPLLTRADQLQKEAELLTADLERLTAESAPLTERLAADSADVTSLLERAVLTQQVADGLMADVQAARDKAQSAAGDGERTLEEAQRTLATLQGFDRQVQLSRQRASEALQLVDQIRQLVDAAGQQTAAAAQAGLADAEGSALDAQRIATEAEQLAQQANSSAWQIQSEAAAARGLADQLQEDTSQLDLQSATTGDQMENHERQAEAGAALAGEALARASEAKSAAAEARGRVQLAVDAVREIQAVLAAAGELDAAAVDQLERRLSAAEQQLQQAQLTERLQQLRTFRSQQTRLVRKYEADLALLRQEVINVQEVADALPQGCYARVKLEP